MRIADEHLQCVLNGLDYLVQDGAMGTMLQARGIASEQADLLCLEQPEAITAIHRAYVEAGAEMVITNTFGANSAKLGSVELVERVYAAAEQCARAAGARYVAGDIGPTGELIEPLGSLSFDDAYQLFAEQARAIAKTSCDLVVIETMADLREAKAALLAAKDYCDVPVIVTMTYASGGKTFLGVDPVAAVKTLQALGADIVGMNCSLGPDAVLPIVERIKDATTRPVEVRPNAGLPKMVEGHVCYDVTPEAFAQSMEAVLDAGVRIVGGCCGTTPNHIAALAEAVQKRREPNEDPIVRGFSDDCIQIVDPTSDLTSDSQVVSLCGEPVVVAGFPSTADAVASLDEMLEEGDTDSLVDEVYAARDDEAGAFFLDLSATSHDDVEHLGAVVAAMQEVCPMPLVVRASDAASLEAALGSYAGRPAFVVPEGVSAEERAALLASAVRLGALPIVKALAYDNVTLCDLHEELEEAGFERCDLAFDCSDLVKGLDAESAIKQIAFLRNNEGCIFISDVSAVADELADHYGWESLTESIEGEEFELTAGILF